MHMEISIEIRVTAVIKDVKRSEFLSYFFVKKIPLSRRVAYVLHGLMGESASQ